MVEENAHNYIYESMKYAESNLNIMVLDAKNISLAIATNSDIILENILSKSQAATHQKFRDRYLNWQKHKQGYELFDIQHINTILEKNISHSP